MLEVLQYRLCRHFSHSRLQQQQSRLFSLAIARIVWLTKQFNNLAA
jgi:hypothetical protein